MTRRPADNSSRWISPGDAIMIGVQIAGARYVPLKSIFNFLPFARNAADSTPGAKPAGPQEIAVKDIQFLGEQDGPPERDLKQKFAALFREDGSVSRAYLARAVLNGDETSTVVLALMRPEGDNLALVKKVAGIFDATYGASQHLDTIYLSDAQETRLAKVCRPFFEL
jgi:hypothetical protein